MIEVTEAAAAVIQAMRSEAGAPEEAGVRMLTVQTDDGRDQIGLAFTSEPEQDDQVTEQSGVRVFVEQDLTDRLDEAVLDARQTDAGTELVVKV